MTDELRDRLARLDPMRSDVSVEPVDSPASRKLLESTMSTQVGERRATSMRRVPAVAAVAVAVGVIGALALNGGGQPLVLNTGVEDPTASCIVFSVEELAKAPVAFEGTVVSSEDGVVTLDVDEWFRGGVSGQVILEAPEGMEALIGGIPFTAGDTYLITAYDGVVNYCGFSGPSTPELRAAFEAAFSG
ncbi:MAG: hypothetical protein L0Z49_05890 [Actinobacteria bacterium]|nr:hypothetical protein [Actinomycetota bacterium]MCI0678799.1 hypothetical protein [Actinomycetota bacterium]